MHTAVLLMIVVLAFFIVLVFFTNPIRASVFVFFINPIGASTPFFERGLHLNFTAGSTEPHLPL